MWTAESGQAEVEERGAEGFWVTFAWVIAFIVVAEMLWLMLLTKTGTAIELLVLPIAVSISILIVIAVFQQLKASKVSPLCYAAPMMNIILLQATLIFGVPSGGALVSLMVFMAAANALLLALAWDDVGNVSTSGISEMWMAIAPVSCFAVLGSASLATSIRFTSAGLIDIYPILMWSAIWFGGAALVMVMFLVRGQRRTLPPANWALPMLLFLVTVVTITVGPVLILLTQLNLFLIFVVVTVGLVEFSVASVELEPLLRDDLGKIAAPLAFGTGYMLSFICVLLAWLVIIPGYSI